jgi:hypothetical protein
MPGVMPCIRAKRSKSGAISFELLEGEGAYAALCRGERLLGILGHQTFELDLGPLML